MSPSDEKFGSDGACVQSQLSRRLRQEDKLESIVGNAEI